MDIIHAMDGTLPRALAATVSAALRAHPVVVVTGARQTGKSTLARAVGSERGRSRRELSFDDLAAPWHRVV
jgi:predicted AAA+ superfamily ATPase